LPGHVLLLRKAAAFLCFLDHLLMYNFQAHIMRIWLHAQIPSL
jgi:hypothetical protein